MDFAQTFAKRNAIKHLSGIQKAPCDNWKIPVLAWRPTGNNIIKWDATQYANLQDRVAGLIEGGGSDFENRKKIELQKGSGRTSEDEDYKTIESEIDPEDNPEPKTKTEGVQVQKEQPKVEPVELSKEVKQAVYLSQTFPSEFKEACKLCNVVVPVEEFQNNAAILICRKVSELVDQQ